MKRIEQALKEVELIQKGVLPKVPAREFLNKEREINNMTRILYTKTVCPKCMGIKTAIDRSDKEVTIINIDEDAAAKQKLQVANILSVPVLEKNGEFITDHGTIFAEFNE